MKIHFIAIGGSAMHNLALALKEKGYEITGSDDSIFEPSYTRLKNKNLLPEKEGWYPEKIRKDLDCVILGMHAKPDNIELKKAQELGVKIYSYPEFLYEQSKSKKRIVIAGSHGKTTITSMILHVLKLDNKEVDYMVGAQLDNFDTMVKLTDKNDYIILEGDEYLSSPIDRRSKFLHYHPDIVLISGIAWDHINVFPTFQDYINPFKELINNISKGGTLIYNEEDPEVVKLVKESRNDIEKTPYHIPDYRIENESVIMPTKYGNKTLSVFGSHNLSNLAGAKSVCNKIGVSDVSFYNSIITFKGASKRLEKIVENNDCIVYKDFAHAPSKVTAAVKSVRDNFPKRKLVSCLELHTYSSLNPAFLIQYKDSLKKSDLAIVYYNPEALKIKNMEPISSDFIKQAFNDQNIKIFIQPKELEAFLKNTDKSNSVFLMMSSGNYGGLNLNDIFK